MIQAFVGLVGGGKSFCSVRRMCSYMAQGGRCASNIRLCGWDDSLQDLAPSSPVIPFLESLGWRYQAKQYVYIPYDTMVENPLWYQQIPAGFSRDRRTLCVVDEATDLFDTLDGGKLRGDNSPYRQLFHFLRLSRHAHIDVLFVCQDLNTINSRLRALVSGIWRSTDMRNFRVGIFKLGFPFDVFMLQLFDRSGKNELQRDWVRKDSRIFGLYESETFGGALGVKWDGVSVSNGKIQKGKKKMSLFYKLLIFGLCGLCGFLLYRDLSRPSSPSEPVSSPAFDTNGFVRLVSDRLRGQGGNYSPLHGPSFDVLSPSGDKASASSRALLAPAMPQTSVAPSSSNRYVRGKYDFHQAGNEKWVYFDGDLVKEGIPTEWGRVVLVDKDFSFCVDEDGFKTALLPTLTEFEERRRRVPSARFTSSADGTLRRAGF